MAYVISDSCVSCGTCEGECPVGAISAGDGKYEIAADTCIECGTCAGGKALQRKQVRRPAVIVYIIHGFRVKGDRTNHTDPFYYWFP